MPTAKQWARMSLAAREHALAKMREYYYNHREKRLNAAKKWAREHREIQRARARIEGRKRRGLHAAGDEQKIGICPLCSKETVLVPDHPFGIDRIRGWICRTCNMRLGQYEVREASGEHERFRDYLARTS